MEEISAYTKEELLSADLIEEIFEEEDCAAMVPDLPHRISWTVVMVWLAIWTFEKIFII